MELVDLQTQRDKISVDLDRRLQSVLAAGKFILGPEVSELEEKLALFSGAKHCLGVANGTDALQIALMVLNIRPGDEVITTAFSFFATVETILLLGAQPIFVDIDPKTYNIDANQIENAVTSKTKAILPVSLYGQCSDMDAIQSIALKHGLAVIEDAAQSFGATYKNRRSCNLSRLACTSFFPSKPLGCYGDGGACFTNDAEIAFKIKQIRVHGQDRRYHHPLVGINSRLDTLQAAVLLAKLAIFEIEIKSRIQIAERYSRLLNGYVETPYIEPWNQSAFAQYTIQVDDREKIQKILDLEGIPTSVHYPQGLHQQPSLLNLGLRSKALPNVESVAKRVLSLPMHPYLSIEDQDHVVETLKKAVTKLK